MYAGQIVEMQDSVALVDRPLHPYTAALSAARPAIDGDVHRLAAIRGRPLSAFEAPDGCPYAPRCDFAQARCAEQRPELGDVEDGCVRCLRAGELRGVLVEGAAR
jgi:oligopeptide/dipeptide ABC transporter ATP-binding protein